jgi:hypothetical protein
MEPYIEQTELSENRRNKVISNFPFDDMLHSERIRIIVDEMLAGKSKHAIVLEYADKWNTKPKTIKNMINEAIVYLHQVHTGNSIEEMRSEQVAKLEELYSGATTSEKLKIIDLVSSTLGLYDNKLTVKQEDEIKINLGV